MPEPVYPLLTVSGLGVLGVRCDHRPVTGNPGGFPVVRLARQRGWALREGQAGGLVVRRAGLVAFQQQI